MSGNEVLGVSFKSRDEAVDKLCIKVFGTTPTYQDDNGADRDEATRELLRDAACIAVVSERQGRYPGAARVASHIMDGVELFDSAEPTDGSSFADKLAAESHRDTLEHAMGRIAELERQRDELANAKAECERQYQSKVDEIIILLNSVDRLLSALRVFPDKFGWKDGPEGWKEAIDEAHDAIKNVNPAAE